MGEWINCTLADIGNIVGGATPSTKHDDYYGGDIPWITPKDLSSFSGRYISRGERNITDAGLSSCSAQMLPRNSILFSSRAPIGYVAITAQKMCTNQGFKSVVPNENVDYLFLYYLLLFNKDKIEAMGSGTTFKEVSGKTMKLVPVNIPADIGEQKKIASILGTIDDKIENNSRMNDNLTPAMSRANRRRLRSSGACSRKTAYRRRCIGRMPDSERLCRERSTAEWLKAA